MRGNHSGACLGILETVPSGWTRAAHLLCCQRPNCPAGVLLVFPLGAEGHEHEWSGKIGHM